MYHSEGCTHDVVTTDYHEGTEVCLQCGTVVNDSLLLWNDGTEHQNTAVQTTPTSGDASNEPYLETVLDFCENACIPRRCATDVLRLYHRAAESSSSPYPSFKNKQVLAICLYETAKRQNIPRSLREVAAFTGFQTCQLAQLQKKYFPQSAPLLPHDLLTRFGSQLGLKRNQIIALERRISLAKVTNACNPGTVASAYIVQFVEEQGLRLSTPDICKVSGVSAVAVRRYIRRYLKKKLFYISTSKDGSV
jgi:transcription initiation factor TFIIIB Brf1 subunit/transcription initiation factor TFIIB